MGIMSSDILGIAKDKNKEEAKEYLEDYAKYLFKNNTDIADLKDGILAMERALSIAKSNIGYCAGYHSPEDMLLILKIFDVNHPVFGRSIPTPTEALKAGIKLSKKYKKGDRKKS